MRITKSKVNPMPRPNRVDPATTTPPSTRHSTPRRRCQERLHRPPTVQPLSTLAAAEPLLVALEAVVDPVVITTPIRDTDGRITDLRVEYVNDAVCGWTGLDYPMLLGRSVTAILPSRRRRGLFDALVSMVETGEPLALSAIGYDGVFPGGKAATGRYDIRAVPFGAGCMCVWRDVSDREESITETHRNYVTRIHEMETDLALVSSVSRVLAGAVAKLEAGASLEDAAQAICDELRSLPAVDFAAVGAFLPDDGALILAASAVDGIPLHAGFHLPAHRSDALRKHAESGSWADYWVSRPDDGEWGREMDTAGLAALAFGPIVHGAHVDGGVVIGTRDPAFARSLVEKWASLIDFSTTPSALLAERLHARRTEIALKRSIAEILATGSFRPVFQPIVELATGEVVGHEALTRFSSGESPDTVFADAWTVGLGPDLELATLVSAIAAARRLPPGTWLDLNVSPRLPGNAPGLRQAIRAADRPVVLEITEHDIVDDYVGLLISVRSLGHDIRLAVDDAGAGVANFGHILDLGPDFVKLDTSLVRGVNAHLGRQALIVGMRYFSRTSGCRLVAEGIETEEEAQTLIKLGVEFGQGYWYGRPAAVDDQPAASTS